MADYLIYALQVQCSGLAVRVLLNDALVFEEPGGSYRFSQGKLNPWIIDGPNELAIELGAPPGHSIASDAEFALKVIKGPHGEEPGPDANVIPFSWIADDQPLDPKQMTVVFRGPVPVDEGHGAWQWQGAAPYSAAADDLPIAAVVAQAHQALVNRDAGALHAITAIVTEEMGRALDVPAAELEADSLKYLSTMFATPDWTMEPLDPSSLRYVPSAGGRLVAVTDDHGRPILRGSGGGEEYQRDLTLSKLAQGWTIVR